MRPNLYCRNISLPRFGSQSHRTVLSAADGHTDDRAAGSSKETIKKIPGVYITD